MSVIVDRRNDKNSSAGNRQKFKDHFRQQIKKAIQKGIGNKSITDKQGDESIIVETGGEDLGPIISKDGRTGARHRVRPGNDNFSRGDSFPIPRNSQKDQGGSGDELGDSMVFTLTKEEYLDLYFSDLELPNFVKKSLFSAATPVYKRAGYKPSGLSSQLDLKKSFKHALARKISARAARQSEIDDLEYKLTLLCHSDYSARKPVYDRIKQLKEKHDIYLDDFDLRYRRYEPLPQPECKALVLFFLDVSGSMSNEMIDVARRFFYLMMLFLDREYKHVEPVFILYHGEAKIVDETTFFNTRTSGGTCLEKPLELALETIKDKYNSDEWNIYVCHACDSDSYDEDSGVFIDYVHDLVVKQLSQYIQYYAYLHLHSAWGAGENKKIRKLFERLSVRHAWIGYAEAGSINESYKALRKLFERKMERLN